MDEPLIINVADAPAFTRPRRATLIRFEPDDLQWPDTGVNIQIMQPGQPNCRYHSEPVQEDFLVLHGECVVILNARPHELAATAALALSTAWRAGWVERFEARLPDGR